MTTTSDRLRGDDRAEMAVYGADHEDDNDGARGIAFAILGSALLWGVIVAFVLGWVARGVLA